MSFRVEVFLKSYFIKGIHHMKELKELNLAKNSIKSISK